MALTTTALYLSWLLFSLGQLGPRIFIQGQDVLCFDLALVALALLLLWQNRFQLSPKLIIFLLWLALTFLLNLTNLQLIFTPALYLIRLVTLLILLDLPSPKVKPKFIVACLIFTVLWGFFQYFIYPDARILKYLGWDDHLNRLLGTLLDPTFTGLIYNFIFFTYFLTPKPNKLALGLIYLALALTYSRTSLACFLLGFGYLAYKQKQPKIFFVSLLLVLATIFLLPKPPGEGTNLVRTKSTVDKIENYQASLPLLLQKPLFGYGYNNLGYQIPQTPNNLHSGWFFDNSLLNIALTTGLIGLVIFLVYLSNLFTKSNLLFQTLLLITLFHSLFANSLLYPFVIFFLSQAKSFKYRKLSQS